MGEILAEQLRLNSGQELTIRTAVAGDAEALLEIAHAVLAEDFGNITTVDEFRITVEQERELIQEHSRDAGQIVLVAEVDGIVTGALWFRNSSRRRLQHRGVLNLNVQRQYRRRGIGTALLGALVRWAQKDPIIEKLSLAVLATNEPALALYRNNGFVEEGRRIREVKIADRQYVDEILMYKLVED